MGCVLACCLTSNVHAQNAGGYAVAESGANYRVWQKTTVENGTNRIHRYTELGSGLNFRDPNTGQWTPSREQIDLLTPGGAFAAAATSGQHQASFPLDIAQGIIQLSTPDGKQLRSRPVGLFFEDDSNSVLIAILTNSVGELVGSNQVVYPDAFEGVAASVRYRYTRSGFEQDVIVQGQLPDPASLGLRPARTRLGVLTAFFDTNNPVATAGTVDAADGLSDVALTFGSGGMKMGQGRAFSIGNTEPSGLPANVTPATWLNWITNAAQRASSKRTPIFKRWFQLQGRNFLMEEVPYRRVAAQLRPLPPWTGRLDAISTNLLAADALLDEIPARLLAQSASGTPGETRTMRLSKLDLDKTPALVLDYFVIVPPFPGNYTFQSGTTYYVEGMCDLLDVTLQAGAVIKYANVNSCTAVQIGAWNYGTAYLVIEGTLTCQTTAANPAIFTASDDDTPGEPIGNSTHNPSGNYYANPAIYAPYGVNLSNVRIRHAAQAVYTGGAYYGNTLGLSDSQVTDSGVMAALGCGYGYDGQITLSCSNCLYSGGNNGGMVVLDYGAASDTYNFFNCTFDNIYYVVYGSNNYGSGNAINSIFANTYSTGYGTWNGSYNGFYNCYYYATFGDNQIYAQANPPFTTSGNDHYYLAAHPDHTDASGFRNMGTSAIGPALLADLAAGTTEAPQDGHHADAESPGPDLGYHYPLSEDLNGDGLADWWEMYWFGNLNHSAGDRDAVNQRTLLQDYNANPLADPNAIQFTAIQVTNNYVKHQSVPAQLAVVNYPYYIAILVDDTNLAHAVWNSYGSANVTIPLGATQGWHNVWIGLRGYADAPSAAVWQWKRLKLDSTTPVLVISNPTVGTVSVPMIQLQGYSLQPLGSINYDLANALGLVTNQQVLVLNQSYSTNTWEFTTNTFQAFDVPLTNGVNTITLHATDLAGNISTLSTAFTLDYTGVTDPVIQLIWPQNGEQISGANFTWRGWVDDPTATIWASITDTNGNTTVVPGYTERNGNFWVENLPMPNGTNSLTLAVTNAAGYGSTTNIFVSTNPLTVTMTPIPDGQLWNTTVTASGTISDSTYSLWINGVKTCVSSTLNSDRKSYNWTTNNVPMTPGGVAIFNITTYAPGETQPDNSTHN